MWADIIYTGQTNLQTGSWQWRGAEHPGGFLQEELVYKAMGGSR